jgi:hypothetical protein
MVSGLARVKRSTRCVFALELGRLLLEVDVSTTSVSPPGRARVPVQRGFVRALGSHQAGDPCL